MKYKVHVALKKEILNPEARAICETLQKKGYSNLESLSISRSFHLELKEETENPLETVRELAQKHLTNPLSENFTVTKIEQVDS